MRIDQFVFRHLVYHPTTYLRGQDVFGSLRYLVASQYDPPSTRGQLQQDRFQALVESARANCPEYAVRLAGLGYGPISLRRLGEIPTLSKQELRELKSTLTHQKPMRFCAEKTTGGSTGEPVTIKKTRTAMAWELAATWRGYSWAGVCIGDSQARFWGVPLQATGRAKARLIDFVCHRRRFSAFDFDRISFIDFDRRLRDAPPDYFYGYVSMIAELARWYLEAGHRLSKAPKAVITTSEVLTPSDRIAIQEAFQTRVYNEYGCGELGTVAHECEHGRMHINDENMIVEILDGDRSCGPRERGEIVVTELNNIAMPLIRYRTGDYGAFSDEVCPCGRTLGILDSIAGRAYDFIVTGDGRKFHAELLVYVFEEAQRQESGIAQFRVEQTATNRLDVSVVPSRRGFNAEAETRLVERIKELLGQAMKVSVSRVATIERERSGKMRVIVGMDGRTPSSNSDPTSF